MHAECASRFSRRSPDDLSAESHDAYLHELAKPLGPPGSANPTERKSNMIVPIMARPTRTPSDDPIFPEQIGDDWVAFAKRVPNRAAPGIDRLVAPGSRGYSQDLGHGNGPAAPACRRTAFRYSGRGRPGRT